MDLHFNDIAKKTGMGIQAVRVYMSRPEFSHIALHKGIYYGITNNDLINLKNIYEKRGWRGRK